MFYVAKDSNLSLEERRKAINNINSNYGGYLKHLLTEKSTIQEITAAQNQANEAFLKNIELKAKKDIFEGETKKTSDLYKGYLQRRDTFYSEAARLKVNPETVGGLASELKGKTGQEDYRVIKYASLVKKYEAMTSIYGLYGKMQKGLVSGMKTLGLSELEKSGKIDKSQLEKASTKTSELSGAKGGLGEAKVINIKIDTMQKNDVKNVKDFESVSGQALEGLIRVLNNIVYSNSTTM